MKSDYQNLPPSLAARLTRVDRRLLVVQSLQASFGVLLVLAAIWLGFYMSDRLWNTPRVLRMVFMVGFLGGAAALIWRWLKNRLRCRRDPTFVVRRVQKRFTLLGDSLQGIVELANERERPANISPELCEAAIQQVAKRTESLDFPAAIPTDRAKRRGIVLGLAVAALVVLGVLDYQAVANAFRRWTRPLAGIPRYTFVALGQLPEKLVTPYGEPFDVRVSVDRNSRWLPSFATFKLPGSEKRVADFLGGEAAASLPGQTEATRLKVKAGDARDQTLIVPLHRPVLLSLATEITPPAYLQHGADEREITTKTLSVLSGSKVVFKGSVSRALKSATLTADKPYRLGIEGDMFVSDPLVVDTFEGGTFTWRDELGFAPREPRAIDIRVLNDQAPFVECPGLGRTVAILEDEPLTINLRSEDDYGIREMGLEWDVYAMGSNQRLTPTRVQRKVEDGSPNAEELTASFVFSPGLLDIPPQTMVTLYATATDYMPDRKAATSVEYRIFILSYAEHARLIEEQLRELEARLEEAAFREEELMEGNTEIDERNDEDLQAMDSERDLNRSERGEQSNAAEMQNISEEMSKLIKEALRNENFSEEMLKEWGELAQMMSELGNQDMQQVAQSLQQAQQSPPTPQGAQQRREDVEKAIEKQREILEKMREMAEQMNNQLDDMAIRNLASRLREASEEEKAIAVKLAKLLGEVVGMQTANLPQPLRKQVLALADDQHTVRAKITQIKHDIYGYFSRTKIMKYETVHKDMETKEVLDKLKELYGLIAENQGVNSITEAGGWAQQFQEWAEMLEEQSNEKSDGEGESQEMSPEDLEILFAIMRVIQKEQDIRDQTQFLERHREMLETYDAMATELSEIQQGNRDKLDEVTQKIGDPQVQFVLKKGSEIMVEVEDFLDKPQTDEDTVAAESAVIELLSMLFQGGGGGGGGGGGAGNAALMAMMMQMGLGAGASGGGSMQGGDTDRTNLPTVGNTGGNVTPRESGGNLSAAELEALPVEFRDAIEAYHRQMEETRLE